MGREGDKSGGGNRGRGLPVHACQQPLAPDVQAALEKAQKTEPWPLARETLGLLRRNLDLALEQDLPICQDTGMACVFVELGQEVHIAGDFEAAVNEGVRRGYDQGYLRKSIVADPLRRANTGDNTPAALTLRLVPGSGLRITVSPKGFGSENMSRLAMLKPSDGAEGVERFVLETARLAGLNPCPPMVLGVGIGGSFDKVACLAKKRCSAPGPAKPGPLLHGNGGPPLAGVNALGTGPQGFGGAATALGLAIETAPTHVAGLPVAVNVAATQPAGQRLNCKMGAGGLFARLAYT